MNRQRRSLVQATTAHVHHGCMTRQQARAVIVALLNPSGQRPERAVEALSAAAGFGVDGCRVELGEMLEQVAPAHEADLFDRLRVLSCDIEALEDRARALEAGTDENRYDVAEVLRQDVRQLRTERAALAYALVAGDDSRAAVTR